jgi:TPR repeat protein
MFWYRKRRRAGPRAPSSIWACCTTTARACRSDEKKALDWYRKAAEQGHASAQNNLGLRFEHGQGVAAGPAPGAALVPQGGRAGLPRRAIPPGHAVRRADGVVQDPRRRSVWYRKAAEQGHVRAQFDSACATKRHAACGRDERKAMAWYRRAAEQDYARRSTTSACCSTRTTPDHARPARRRAWYREGGQQGHALAQFTLGLRYDNGQGLSARTCAQALCLVPNGCRPGAQPRAVQPRA